ncbi:MAG: hypothetical protein H7Z40_07635 [Phycisphaerae bacterium]|nr:hypothetical protein [Gemmatimonadaceae bacterium]
MPETAQVKGQAKFSMRPGLSLMVAVGVVLVGYGDLLRGGVTLSAALLSVGYLICIPIAIMAVPSGLPLTKPAQKKPH